MSAQPAELLALFRKTGTQVVRGVVTVQEFMDKTFDALANATQVWPMVVPALWGLVPHDARKDWQEAVRHAARPDFRYHSAHGVARTEDEVRRDAELRAARVRAWAVEFVRLVGENADGP